jgi:hypothetical protein
LPTTWNGVEERAGVKQSRGDVQRQSRPATPLVQYGKLPLFSFETARPRQAQKEISRLQVRAFSGRKRCNSIRQLIEDGATTPEDGATTPEDEQDSQNQDNDVAIAANLLVAISTDNDKGKDKASDFGCRPRK